MQDLRNRDIATMLRTQAWERAKGELRSMIHTFQSTVGYDTTSEYERLNAAVEAFITEVENNGLQE